MTTSQTRQRQKQKHTKWECPWKLHIGFEQNHTYHKSRKPHMFTKHFNYTPTIW